MPGVTLTPSQRCIAALGIKCLMPVPQPFINYVLSSLADAKYKRVIVVIGKQHGLLREHLQKLHISRLKSIEIVEQPAPLGPADALLAAEPLVPRLFTVINADNYYSQVLDYLAVQPGMATVLFEQESLIDKSGIPPDRVRNYALAEFDQQRRLQRVIEKPDRITFIKVPLPHWISMTCWQFDSRIFSACRNARAKPCCHACCNTQAKPYHDYMLPDVVQYLLDRRARCDVLLSHRAVYDLTCQADVAVVQDKLRGVEIRL